MSIWAEIVACTLSESAKDTVCADLFVIRKWQDLIAGLIGAAALAVTVWVTLTVESRRREAELKAFKVALGSEIRQLSDAALLCFQNIDRLLPKEPPRALPRGVLAAYSQMPPPVMYTENADKVGALGEETASGIVHFYGQLALIADSTFRTPLIGLDSLVAQDPSQVGTAMSAFLIALKSAQKLREQIPSSRWAKRDTEFTQAVEWASGRFTELFPTEGK